MSSNYQVEYRKNGIPNVFEFYLFVNPLGRKCYVCEKELDKSINMISAKADLHILCYHNQYIVSEFMEQLGIPKSDLTSRNHIYHLVYLASLAYKTASLQGKRKGRQFLMKMQNYIDCQLERFSEEFIFDLAKEVKLDLPTFIEDFHSDFTRQLVLKDQQIAIDMQIDSTPALIIFEHQIANNGILVQGSFTSQLILSEIDALIESNEQHCPSLSVKKILQFKK